GRHPDPDRRARHRGNPEPCRARRREAMGPTRMIGGLFHEPRRVAAGHVRSRARGHGALPRLRERVRENLRSEPMIYLAAATSLFLVVYLFRARIGPEWF